MKRKASRAQRVLTALKVVQQTPFFTASIDPDTLAAMEKVQHLLKRELKFLGWVEADTLNRFYFRETLRTKVPHLHAL